MAFRVYQSLWGMTALPYGGAVEWTIAEKVAKAIEGGFDGVEIPWTPTFPTQDAVAVARERGVAFGVTCYPTSIAAFQELAPVLRSLEPEYVNVQPNVRVSTVAEGAPVIRGWLEIAAEAGLPVTIETHRDRMTTDLRFTLRLLDEVPELRLTADLSHFVVGQEFPLPVSDENHALIRRVIERADVFHGRVASREQVQITPGWDRHREWLELFLGWWEHGFALWRERSGADAHLHFVTELGPPWYAITGADGRELSDRWEDALFLQERVREVWDRVASGATT